MDRLTCRELYQLVTDYFEGAMEHRVRERFEVHLRRCPPCVSYIGQMEITIRTVGRLREDEVPEQAKVALIEAFRDWKSEQSPGRS